MLIITPIVMFSQIIHKLECFIWYTLVVNLLSQIVAIKVAKYGRVRGKMGQTVASAKRFIALFR